MLSHVCFDFCCNVVEDGEPIDEAAEELLRGVERYSGETSEYQPEVITALRDAINAVLATNPAPDDEDKAKDNEGDRFCNKLDLITLAWQVFMKKNKEARKAANLLDAYMQVRAEQEGVGYELTPEFFKKIILSGISGFFGTIVENGRLVCDKEQPSMFEQWESKRKRLD